jgi:cobalt-zinc-cadmium efflux system outer membrane protein
VNPRVQVDGRRTVGRGAGEAGGWAAAGEVTFEVADAAGARRDEAARRLNVARSELMVSTLEARLLAFRAYVDAKLGELRTGYAREAVAIAERLQVVARRRLEAGAGSEIETTSADVELADRRAALQEVTTQWNDADRELHYLLGLPADQPLKLTFAIDHPDAAPRADQLIAMAMSHRPDLHVIRDRIDMLSAADRRLAREAQPKVGVFGGVDASPDAPTFGIVGLVVELPVAQRNQGRRAVTEAARQTELLRLDVERRGTAHAVRAARSRYESRRIELGLLAREAIPAAERRLQLVEEGWRAGRFDVLRVTTAARDLVQLRERWGSILAEIWGDRLLLERLIGAWPAAEGM